jgi:hypothetical protein
MLFLSGRHAAEAWISDIWESLRRRAGRRSLSGAFEISPGASPGVLRRRRKSRSGPAKRGDPRQGAGSSPCAVDRNPANQASEFPGVEGASPLGEAASLGTRTSRLPPSSRTGGGWADSKRIGQETRLLAAGRRSSRTVARQPNGGFPAALGRPVRQDRRDPHEYSRQRARSLMAEMMESGRSSSRKRRQTG